jgi:hypothetical protein
VVSCEVCREIYDGNPPCDKCSRPTLKAENELAWYLWTLLSESDRPVGFGIGRIPTSSIIQLCEVYGANLETFEKILFLEDHMYPVIIKRSEERTKRGK